MCIEIVNYIYSGQILDVLFEQCDYGKGVSPMKCYNEKPLFA